MKTMNPDNERVKREYIMYLKEADRRSEQSLDAALKALHRFETHTGFKDFKTFRREQAIAFKRHLALQANIRTGERLAKATLYSTLADLRKFFRWLADQPGFKRPRSDADYFNMTDKETAVAKARRERPVPTLEQIRHVIASMPATTEIERRDRAVVAFAILTGARDGAIASFKLKHIDIEQRLVEHDAREVKTKFSKTFPTWFFPVGDDIESIVVEWVEYLLKEKKWGLDDPIFPATELALDAEHKFEPVGLRREHWSSASPIRAIVKRACIAAGMPTFNPHSFRKTLVRVIQRLSRTPEEYKAWSQNLGHADVLTTLTSYGTVTRERQAEIICAASTARDGDGGTEELLERIAAKLGV